MAEIVLIIVYFTILSVAMLLAAAQYIMQAYAYMKIGKKRGVKNSWLSWIPAAENYVVGKITSSYDEERGIKHSWGKALLIAFGVGYAIFFVAYIVYFVLLVFIGILEETTGSASEIMLLFFICMAVLVVAVLSVSVWNVMRMICEYKNFEGMVPGKAVKYMILKICVPLAGPILLMKCAKNIPDVNEISEIPEIE